MTKQGAETRPKQGTYRHGNCNAKGESMTHKKKAFRSKKTFLYTLCNIRSNNTLANKNIIKHNQGYKKDAKGWNC